MIITNRQRKIIHLLQKNDLTSEKIAEYLDVSTRTVMRDIAELNDSFQSNHLAVIEANYQGQGYHLIIYDDQQFVDLITLKPDAALNVLFMLTRHPEVLLIDFQEKLFLSKSAIIKILIQLKDQYCSYANIQAKPSKGYQLITDYATRLFLAANILLEDKATLFSSCNLETNSYQSLITYIEQSDLIKHFNFLTPRQFLLLALAATQVFTDSTMLTASSSAGQPNLSSDTAEFINDVYGKIAAITKIKIDAVHLFAFINQLQTIKCQLQALSIENIHTALQQTSLTFHMQFGAQGTLAEQIFNHLGRSIAFPSLINNFDDINQLTLVNPMIYNFSHCFLNALNEIQQFVILDDSYTFLYFLSAHSVYQMQYTIQLISSRWSIANINKKLIEDKIPNANVICHVGQYNFDIENEQQYIIWNQDDIPPNSLSIDQLIKGIFDPNTLTILKSNLQDLNIKFGIEQCFKQSDIMQLSLTHKHNSWLDVMRHGCDMLQQNNLLVEQDAQQLIARESQGHSLIINNIVIPHASSVYVNPFAMSYWQLDKPQLIDGQQINQVLLVLVNPEHKENSNIFSYLYKVLNRYSKEQIAQISSLVQLKEMLLNNTNS